MSSSRDEDSWLRDTWSTVKGWFGGEEKPDNIKNPVISKPRSGSALKQDPHHAFPDLVDNFVGDAQQFVIPKKGPGGKISGNADLFQVDGSLRGQGGIFEWIVDNGKVTHRRFIPNGKITGIPNQKEK